VLLKSFQDDPNDLACSFTCKAGYDKVQLDNGEEDCFVSSLSASKANSFTHFVQVTNIQRDATGFQVSLLHSNHSRFLVVVGPQAPTDCKRIRGCCYDSQWRVSTLSQAGFPSSATEDGCSKSPLLNSIYLLADTLQFSIPDSLLDAVGTCTDSQLGSVCNFTVSIIDTLLWGVSSQPVSIRSHRAMHYALVGEQEYLPLNVFAVNVFLAYVLPSNENVYLIQTRVGTQLDQLGVRMRVQGMTQMQDSEVFLGAIETCMRAQFQSGANVLNSNVYNVSGGTEKVSLSYWKGSSDLVQAYYTLLMQGGESDMDVIAMRNMQNFSALCSYPEVSSSFDLIRVNAFSGMGTQSVYAMNWLSNPTHSVRGELGTLTTFIAQALTDTPSSIGIKNCLAVYLRGAAAHQALQGHIANATTLHYGNLDFSYSFRQLCRNQGLNCEYEYLRSTPPYQTIHALNNCSQAEKISSHAWLKTYYGVPHDAGHVEAICAETQRHPDRSFTAFMVNTMSFLNRNTWGIWQNTAQEDIITYVWANFEIRT
tara:strand:- start:6446 stop:8053 length:1608 start_codon:yes stop_codon:yes gene_type:complete